MLTQNDLDEITKRFQKDLLTINVTISNLSSDDKNKKSNKILFKQLDSLNRIIQNLERHRGLMPKY